MHLRTSHSDFNPRSREGSDIRSGRGGQAVAHFNPRSREGSDAYSSAFWRVITNFNPRSREGSDNSSSHSCRQIKNFNPRSREGSDGDQAVFTPVSVISIHAPVKGATRHAGRRCCRTGYFNPRSREGSDGYMTGITQNVGISIHAPAKGATARTGKDFFRYGYFNPRSREGSDRLIFRLKEIIQEFQSTLPRRERLKTVYLDRWCNRISIHAPAKGATRAGVGWWFACVYFNPRSREGSDANGGAFPISAKTFQSTLPRRERRYKRLRRVWDEVFQSTLPRRERHFRVTFPSESSSNFNPRSREGSDVEIAATVMHAVRFQSTLPRRERRCPSRPPSSGRYFNPRSREGSDAA